MTKEDMDKGFSEAIRTMADYHRAPDSLTDDILAALPDDRAPRRRAWQGWLAHGLSYAGVVFLTWAITVAMLRPNEEEQHAEDIVAAHVRATLGQRLIDVASSDQHTVKPWLSARLPYSPPVADLSAQGYELVGARLDRSGGKPVAVLVYKRRQHVIDAYVWPAHEPVSRAERTRDGFQLLRFPAGEWGWWLVSDLNRNELDDLARLLAQN